MAKIRVDFGKRLWRQSEDRRTIAGKTIIYYKLSRRSPEYARQNDSLHVGREAMSDERLALFNEDWGGETLKPKPEVARFYAGGNEAELEAYRQHLALERQVNLQETEEERAAAKKKALEQLENGFTFSTEDTSKMFIAQQIKEQRPLTSVEKEALVKKKAISGKLKVPI